MSGFTHLHVHTQYSALESTVQIDALLEKCKEFGMSAVAMTDHGNLCGAIDFFNAAKKAKIKPIFGCDIYLAADAEGKEAYRLLLLAKDRAGFQNLSDLISRSYLEGLGDRPVVQKAWLEEKAEGLLILAGGMKSELGRYLLTGQMEKADAFFSWAKAKFGKNFYATLQVNGLAEQDKLNLWLVEKCTKENVEYVATSDVHYLLKEDASAHEILACTKLGRTISDPLRRNLCSEYWFKDSDTIAEQFAAWPMAIENTQKIVAACNVEFKFTDEKGRPIYYLPNFQIPPEEKTATTVEEYLRLESERGLR